MIKFICALPAGLVPLVNKTVVDYGLDYIRGIVDEGLTGQLRHCSMYMICEYENNHGVSVYRNPLAVVAHNDTEAMEAYVRTTGKENGSILCIIYDRCDNVKVEPA